MIAHAELTADEVRRLALEVMERHVKVPVSGYPCASDMLYNGLLKAAAEGMSLEAVCQELDGLTASNTLRVPLNKALNVTDLKRHAQGRNEALAEWIPPTLFQRRLELARDTQDEPCYGNRSAFEG